MSKADDNTDVEHTPLTTTSTVPPPSSSHLNSTLRFTISPSSSTYIQQPYIHTHNISLQLCFTFLTIPEIIRSSLTCKCWYVAGTDHFFHSMCRSIWIKNVHSWYPISYTYILGECHRLNLYDISKRKLLLSACRSPFATLFTYADDVPKDPANYRYVSSTHSYTYTLHYTMNNTIGDT